MSDKPEPGDIPPDLPPEYAEAYRRGYQRAYLEATGRADEPRVVEPVETTPEPPLVEPEPRVVEPVETTPERPDPEPEYEPPVRGPLFADEYAAILADDDVEPTQTIHLSEEPPPADPDPAYETEDSGPFGFIRRPVREPEPAPESGADEARTRPGWFVPAVFAGLIVLLVLGAYGIGRMLSSSVGGADVAAPEPDGVVLGDGAAESEAPPQDGPSQRPRKGAYEGAVEAVPIGGASATCQAPSSVDAAGNRIGYPPANAYDGDLTTAWRCNGTGVGQSLTLTLPEVTRIGEVALVPGYAKTDPRSGVDRYAENNRLSRVRWSFADGSSVVQRLDTSPDNRTLQAMRIRPVESDTVVVEVLASERGARNTMAVSEVQVGRTAE